MIDTYFIYVHRRDDTNEVFYVGKGTRTQTKQYSRAYVTTKRNHFWRNITSRTTFTVELVADFFTEEDAFEMERELIATYRRRKDGGTLCNLTLGERGTAAILRAMRRAQNSAPHFLGRSITTGEKAVGRNVPKEVRNVEIKSAQFARENIAYVVERKDCRREK